jgi:hypothetical protein
LFDSLVYFFFSLRLCPAFFQLASFKSAAA